VIIDHSNKRVLDILESRDKQSVMAYLREKKEGGLLAGVREVTCDMWDAYANGAVEVFGPEVRVTIDRFHVMKNFQECMTTSRREIQRGLDKEQAKELKGTRWLWVTNWDNLGEGQREQLRGLKEHFPRLKELAEQREKLRDIFEDTKVTNAEEGEQRLRGWMEEARRLGLKGLEGFCKMLTNWLGRIANYFVTRSSNGRTEGFNLGLRSVLWRAFGMSNFHNFRLRILHRFGQPANR
jgi:transposase